MRTFWRTRRRQIGIALCVLIGVAGAYFGQPLAHGNSDVVTVLITVMTVFAGFLVAIIAVLGDPAMIPGETWQAIELRRDGIHKRLIRHQWLFVFYLLAIGFLFVGILLSRATPTSVPVSAKVWVERAYLFFGIASFCLTFGMPWALLNLQLARLETETQNRRRRAGRNDEPLADEPPPAQD